MGRPRTPSNVLQLKGAFAKNPKRGRERAEEMEAIGEVGEPPDFLQDAERVAWEELKEMVPAGCLCRSDRAHLAIMSKLYAFLKETPTGGYPPALLGRFMVGVGAMGMNPIERSKVKIPKGPDTNPFDELDAAG